MAKAKKTEQQSVAVLDQDSEPVAADAQPTEAPAKRTRTRKPKQKEMRDLEIGSLHLIRSGKRYCEVKVVGISVDGGYFVRNQETGRSFLVEDTSRIKPLGYQGENKQLNSLQNKLAKAKALHEKTVMKIEDLNAKINDLQYQIDNYQSDELSF